jgi:hypothetical protein
MVDAVVEIDGLISNEETLHQSEFQIPPPIAKPIIALAEPRTNRMQCTIIVKGRACGYICCTTQ